MKGVWFDILPRMVGMKAEADKIVAESEKAGESAGKAFSGTFSRESTSATAKSVEAMKAQVNAGASALEQASVRSVKAYDSVADAAGRVRIKEAALNDARTLYSEDSVKFIRAEEALATAKRNTATASATAQLAANDENAALDALATKQAALTAKQDEVAASAGGLSTALKGAATLGVGAVIIGFGEAVKKGAEFDQKMTLIQTSAGEQAGNIEMLKSSVLALSSQWGDSATETEDALLRVERAGYHGSDAVTVLGASMQQAKSEGAPLVEVADQLTTSMKDYNKTVGEAVDVASLNVATMANFKGTMEDFASSIGSVEETAHNAGVSMMGLDSALDEMTQHGLTSQRATDNLNHAIQKLATGGTPAMRDELGQLGITADQLQSQLADPNVGLAGAVENISNAIVNKMGPAGKVLLDVHNQSKQAAADAGKMMANLSPEAQTIAQQYVQSGGNVRKMGQALPAADQGQLSEWASKYKDSTGFNDMLKSGNTDAQSYLQAMKAATGDSTTLAVAQNLSGENSADYQRIQAFNQAEAHPDANGDVKGADQANSTLNSRTKVLKSTIGNDLTALGDSSQGPVTAMVNDLIKLADWARQSKTAVEGIGIAVGGLAAAWATIKIAQGVWGGLKTIVNGVKSVVSGVGKVASTAGDLISAGAGGVKNFATSAKDWWTWTGSAKATAMKDFVATKASAVSESVASGAAWVRQGVVAGGAWVGMQARAAGAFVATKASAVSESVSSGAAWVAQGVVAGTAWAGMQIKAAAAFVATKASALSSAAETTGAWLAANAKVAASFVITEGAAVAASAAEKGMAAATWLLDAAMDANPVGIIIVGVVALGAGLYELYKHSETFRNIIQDVWSWIKKWYEVLLVALGPIGLIIDAVIETVKHFGTLKDIVHDGLTIMHDTWNWLWDNAIKPTGDLIKTGIQDVGTAFSDAKTVAVSAWNDLQKALGEPTYAIIQYVYNDGIRKMWNGASNMVGGALGTLPEVDVSNIPHFAGGGVYSGPGIVGAGSGWPNDDVNAKLSKDEGIAVPGFVKAFGVDNWHAANRYFAGRGGGDGFHFDTGGIFSDITSVFSDAAGGADWLRKKFDGVLQGAEGAVGGSGAWREMLLQMPAHLVGKLVDWGMSKVTSGVDGIKHVLGFADGGVYDGADGTSSADTGELPTGELQDTPALVADTDSDQSAGVTAAAPKSGLQVALSTIRDHIATMYKWGGYDLSSGVDCSGLVGDALLLATGKSADHRVGDTTSMMGGSWPGMIKGATEKDLFVAGVNSDHTVGRILGTGIEARQSGEHIRMGADASSPFDKQFVEQWHLDPTLINPAYQPGASDDPTTTADITGTSATDKAARWKAAAQKELDAATKHDADAEKYMAEAAKYKDGLPEEKQKHLEAMQQHLAAAAKADELAAKTTGAVHDTHIQAAAHDRELAQKAQDEAGNVGGKGQKYLDEAAKARQMAADERKRAQEDLDKAKTAAAKSTKTKDGTDSNGGWLTFEQAGEKAGGIAATAALDEFGLDNSLLADPNKSAILRIGKQLTNITPTDGSGQWKAPNWQASPFLPAQTQDQTGTGTDTDLSTMLPATHDLGGPIPPGLSLVNNRTGGDEVLVINPKLMGQREPAPAGAGAGRSERSGPMVHIGTWVAATDNEAEANRLGRVVGQYVRNR